VGGGGGGSKGQEVAGVVFNTDTLKGFQIKILNKYSQCQFCYYFKLTLFWPDEKVPFYKLKSDPD
jgi:hypothetical protein